MTPDRRIGSPNALAGWILQSIQAVARICKIGTRIGNFRCIKAVL
jgi:hypothetical protein